MTADPEDTVDKPDPSANGDDPALAWVVHQATGMVMTQLDVEVHAAAERLREYAVRMNRSVTDVAEDIVAHRLNLATG